MRRSTRLAEDNIPLITARILLLAPKIEFFGPTVLAWLLDGPKPQPCAQRELQSVLEHLKSAGMVKRKMLRQGSVATAWWYMADEEAPSVASPSVKMSPRCDDPGIFDGMPDSS